MRLICPNCSAEYEVDAAHLPPGGRHVVCSACNFTWFEEPEKPDVRADEVPAPPAAESTPEQPTEAQALFTPARPDRQGPELPPRTVSGTALDILREEAEFEARLRARDVDRQDSPQHAQRQGAVPVPEDVLPPGPKAEALPGHPSANLPSRPTVLHDGDTAAHPNGSPGPRARVVPTPIKAAPRKGLSRWFALPVGVLAALILVYLLAPGIILALPEAEGAITAYVQEVDTLRTRLHTFIDR